MFARDGVDGPQRLSVVMLGHSWLNAIHSFEGQCSVATKRRPIRDKPTAIFRQWKRKAVMIVKKKSRCDPWWSAGWIAQPGLTNDVISCRSANHRSRISIEALITEQFARFSRHRNDFSELNLASRGKIWLLTYPNAL